MLCCSNALNNISPDCKLELQKKKSPVQTGDCVKWNKTSQFPKFDSLSQCDDCRSRIASHKSTFVATKAFETQILDIILEKKSMNL